MPQSSRENLQAYLDARYSDAPKVPDAALKYGLLSSMAQRGSCRAFKDEQVPYDLIQLLCATALASPTKSDLQQRDIVLLQAPAKRQRLAALVGGQVWVSQAPMIAVFCGNNRRHRLIHDRHGIPFANDHLDAFFNATADAAIALGAFVTAAEALGLGCCPISAVRNKAQAVSDLLGLPAHVFPFAGLAFGYPSNPHSISKRLPLNVTCHVDAYREENLLEKIESYDANRAQAQPYAIQRFQGTFGTSDTYGWSEDKARQYSAEERADFGAFVRAKGFKLD